MSAFYSANRSVFESQSANRFGLLEAQAIQIFREVAAEAENPVFLYSVGKDSAVMLHLALKAFYPAMPPFRVLHIDTTWKFREMIDFRDNTMSQLGIDLLVHINPEGLSEGVGPFTHGSARHTEIMKTANPTSAAMPKKKVCVKVRCPGSAAPSVARAHVALPHSEAAQHRHDDA